VNYPVGTGPIAAAVGDFNRDGNLDLAVANAISNDVSILLGNGDGTFQPAASYGAGATPEAIATGDFNQDGKLDLAVADAHGVSVLLGRGDGTFQSARNIALDATPRSIAVADFNGDGKPDLAVGQFVSPAPGHVSVLLGNGDGSFQAPANYSVYYAPTSLAVADFNGDGNSDLATSTVESQIGILLGNGDGTFQPVQYLQLREANIPVSVAAGDFNRDDKLDLFETNQEFCLSPPCDFQGVELFLGNGDGSFHTAAGVVGGLPMYNRSSAFGLADFNLDGNLDAAFVSWDGVTATVSVLTGNGDGTFQPPVTFVVGVNPVSLLAADLSGNSLPDLVLVNSQSNSVSVLQNTLVVPTFTLSLTVSGTGRGVVIIHPGLALCAQSCSESFASGTQATLGVLPDSGSSFAGWGGGCSGMGSCLVVMNSDQSVTATFNSTVSPDFSLSMSVLTPSTVSTGQSASATASITAIGTFNSSVSFTCSVQPSPTQAPTCSVNPTSSTSDTTLTIDTTPSTSTQLSSSLASGLFSGVGLTLLAMLVAGAKPGPRQGSKGKSRGFLLCGVLLAGTMFQAACSGSGNQGRSGGTPAGAYTVTVTGTSGSIQHSTTVTLTVH
jgi:hypothetical protein